MAELANARAFTELQLSQGDIPEEARQTLLQRLQTIDGQRLSILMKQTEQIREARDAHEEMTKAARDNISVEEKRLSSLDGIVGRMNQIEQMELKRFADKAKGGGEFSKAELSRLESLGGAGTSDFVANQFAAIGKKQGGADLFSPFLGQAQRGAGSELQNLKETLRLMTDPAGANAQIRSEDFQKIADMNKERVKIEGQILDTMRDLVSVTDLDKLRAQLAILEEKIRNGRLRDRD